jgi:hypothetical protein
MAIALHQPHLMTGDQELMGADAPPEMFETPQGFYVSLHFKEPNVSTTLYQKTEPSECHSMVQLGREDVAGRCGKG